ncbi:hypothetical protein [Streptomyces omiyaensis]|uniref:Uncharacterized protein n=1 Tax=Streptomyces omiyaensis TaxID=68247 RepID=A0ABW7BZI3_9ACTN|nr:hypothetical protein [Streptomyces omiyaensis]GGY57665.1 hypothetical protein GCM10010363_43700 [Streptomyces omiyaensis]
MPYETGARVKLIRDVQITGGVPATGGGSAGPLFLGAGATGVVAGAAEAAGGAVEGALADFDRRFAAGRFDGHTTGLMEGIRRQIVSLGATVPGAGGGIRYRVRFENGFVLDGIEEDALAPA